MQYEITLLYVHTILFINQHQEPIKMPWSSFHQNVGHNFCIGGCVLLKHIVCYSMSPPATKQKHPGVCHRNKNDSTLGKQFDSQDEQPWLEIWGGLTH